MHNRLPNRSAASQESLEQSICEAHGLEETVLNTVCTGVEETWLYSLIIVFSRGTHHSRPWIYSTWSQFAWKPTCSATRNKSSHLQFAGSAGSTWIYFFIFSEFLICINIFNFFQSFLNPENVGLQDVGCFSRSIDVHWMRMWLLYYYRGTQ